jgi:hypothetical protein
MSEEKRSPEEEERIKEARKKGEILSQFNEFMERYQSDEASKIEKEVFDKLRSAMIAQIFLEQAYQKDDPKKYIEGFIKAFEEVNKDYFKTNYVDLIPDGKKVENLIFATMFPSREKVQKEIDQSFEKAAGWYYRYVTRNYILENKNKKDESKSED